MKRFMGGLFKGWGEGDAFQGRVLKLLRQLFPERSFKRGADADTILSGDVQFGLQNLRAALKLGDGTDEELVHLIKLHFEPMLQIKEEKGRLAWDEVGCRLRPQFCPEEFKTQAPLAHAQVCPGLIIAVVVDSDKSYRYLIEEELARWGKGWDEVFCTALENLNQACQGKTEMHYVPGPDRIIALQTHDGFDAARILIPEFRGFVGSKLGSPFLFGIPNRDFLICWSHDNSQNFLTLTTEKIRRDHAEQPYPLSPEVFQGSKDGFQVWVPR